MEIQKANIPSVPYQGSGAEVAVKQETVVKEPVQTSEAPKIDNRVSTSGAAVSNNQETSKEENQNSAETEMAKKNGIKRAVEEVNRKAKNSELIFGIHDATNRVTIKVVDKGTKEVIREFPPEETLDMIAKVWELAGIMVDERR